MVLEFYKWLDFLDATTAAENYILKFYGKIVVLYVHSKGTNECSHVKDQIGVKCNLHITRLFFLNSKTSNIGHWQYKIFLEKTQKGKADLPSSWFQISFPFLLFPACLIPRLTIEFEVRTTADSGLLFYMARINHADFATVQIKNGLPYFSYDLGSGNTSTMITNKINDGQWHQV